MTTHTPSKSILFTFIGLGAILLAVVCLLATFFFFISTLRLQSEVGFWSILDSVVLALAASFSILLLVFGNGLVRSPNAGASRRYARRAVILSIIGTCLLLALVYFYMPHLHARLNDFEIELPGMMIWVINENYWLAGKFPGQRIPGLLWIMPILLGLIAGSFVWLNLSAKQGAEKGSG